ncbi:Cd(II)/Pb(II)-responsive transcriptional regulator [Rubrivivax gelatinosus]|uniref:Cd(II)/Pb(II)-responsive transcriptional regulator n=1 Tax=Rubrivivax gelatinosus TaxID=28068 RepID=A0ABS1E4U8_RUBGE|nr:Cd(II)/Pb(II)-responsive transcriptional regulator [Rubrivivax gelatinosus]MBK1613596.1 Cd(II)/Pb(II)-responsive transcriptional regulator [Rubrivivax gelatinosus]MBK1715967.1 Cd(II)/Pb(II)-responsive transcriptional regulator [Rubrivivax gelatinosus]
MRIGELAAACGTPVETIRYYEREGLLPVPPRSDGNYRVYGSAELERLAFIRQCRALDMSLDEVRALLAFRDAPPADCSGVNALLDEHIGHVVQRIDELRALETALRGLRQRCDAPGAGAACGILHGLEQAVVPVEATRRAAASSHEHAGTHGRRR